MKLLVLGGTKFLGRHLVASALKRGDEVTLFNRGQTNPDIFPEVERLRGRRDGGLGALRGRRWDAVVDTSGYVPRVVRDAAGLLADAVEFYVFTSSMSVYADFSEPNDEDSKLATLADESVEEVTVETYGALKALCERAVEEVMPGRVLVARAGLIVGPFDPTGRFTYSTARAARGGAEPTRAAPESSTLRGRTTRSRCAASSKAAARRRRATRTSRGSASSSFWRRDRKSTRLNSSHV